MTFNGKLCHDSNSPWKAELEPIIRTQALVTSLSPLTQTSQALGLSGDPRCSLLVSQPEPEAFGDPIGELPYENDGTNQFFWVP